MAAAGWRILETGDIEGITTSSTSGLSGGGTSGTPSLSVSPNSATAGTIDQETKYSSETFLIVIILKKHKLLQIL